MIKTIFFPVLAGAINDAALASTCTLARRHDAHVVAVICISAVTPVPAAWSYYPLAVYDTLNEAAHATSSRLYRDLVARLEASGVSYEAQVSDTVWMTTSEIAAVHARYADITVFGRVDAADSRMEAGFFADLLLQSGRPLLLLPAGVEYALDGLAVAAWKPTREATRALHDALPLLHGASTVQVAMVEPRAGSQDHGTIPGADIARHLARHGLDVEVVAVPRLGSDSGAALLRHAREQGASLLVAGGYGHRRMREQVFGGVTRQLFQGADMAVLFSH